MPDAPFIARHGKVLVVGGSRHRSAETYDTVTGAWTPAGSMFSERSGQSVATALANGRVLASCGVFGSLAPASLVAITNTSEVVSTEQYHPTLGEWSAAGMMVDGPRAMHTATLLKDGRVLVVGGHANAGRTIADSFFRSAELYDPDSQVWTFAASMSRRRYNHSATRLANGLVLVVGGDGPESGTPQSAEVYDPISNRWTEVAPPTTPRAGHSATLMSDGSVVVAGGRDPAAGSLNSVEIYTPHPGQWRSALQLNRARSHHTATRLPNDGILLICGDRGGGEVEATAEIWDPAIRRWRILSSFDSALSGHTATLLPTGKVLLAGGASGWVTVDGRPQPNELMACRLFDHTRDVWDYTGNMTEGRHRHSAAVIAPRGSTVVGPTGGGEVDR